MNRSFAGALCGLLIVVGTSASLADVPVRYRVTFESTWSQGTHPDDFPTSAHISPPIGALHNTYARFWKVGELASNGVKNVAELGWVEPFRGEIIAEADSGNASYNTIDGFGFDSPGSEIMEFEATFEFWKVTLITMIAPSPDWFTGTRGLDLLEHGVWKDGLVFELHSYDAGTDSGATYESADLPTTPPEPIALITSGPLAPGNEAIPMGTYTFEILDVDGLPPHDDTDGDGLDNLEEAAQGSDPRVTDTDGDGVGDAEDVCPLVSDPVQSDTDGDGLGNFCDNCISVSNPAQKDFDNDGQGDLCDLTDGLLFFTSVDKTFLDWQNEFGFSTFHLYRGDLAVLKSTGVYTQDPASGPNADRFCGLLDSSHTDTYAPPAGEGLYYLATADNGAETSLGMDSAENERPNDHPCP